MKELAVRLLASYLVGSIMGGLVIGWRRGVDIRALGSGNAGATNALRTQGRGFALGVVAIDIAKGWVATRIIPGVPLGLPVPDSLVHNWLPSACGAAAMLGHVYPLWFGFRGGKAVATLIGVLLGLAPILLAGFLATWVVVVCITGFVSLASVLAACSLPLELVVLHMTWITPYVALAWFAALLILYTHRGNLTRIVRRREPRARRLWLLGARPASFKESR